MLTHKPRGIHLLRDMLHIFLMCEAGAKMRASDWDEANCERMTLGLSEAEPIRGMYSRFRNTDATVFDMHYELELGIVCRGRMRREFRGWSAALGPGEVWLSGLWEPHRARIVTAPCEAAVAVVYPDMLADMRYAEAPDMRWLAPFTTAPERRPRTKASQRAAALELGGRMRALLKTPDTPRRRLLFRAWLIEALLLLQENWQQSTAVASGTGGGFSRINAAVRLVLEGNRPVGAVEAARACRLSRSQFDRLFIEVMGLPFGRFELRRRVHGAARRILSSDAPLKAVALDWGFSSASHLTRRFADFYGCAPGEYRRRCLQRRK